MNRILSLAVVALGVALAALPMRTLADVPDACNDMDPLENAASLNNAIKACTQFIQSGGNGDAYDLSQAYEYRGAYYKYQGRRDPAIADYRAALKLFPMNCPANRAEAAGACGGLMDLGVTP